MRTSIGRTGICVTALLLAGAAHAQGAAEGFYAGVGLGQSNFKDTSLEELGIVFDEDDFAIKGFGGFRINPYIGAEIAYHYLGNPTADILGITFDLEPEDFVISAVPSLPINGFIELFAKASLHIWEVNGTARLGSSVLYLSDDGNDFGWGLGAALGSDEMRFRVEYEQADFGDAFEQRLLSVSIVYSF